jgi:hypothetical protein
MKKKEFEKELTRLTDRSSDVRAAVGRILDAWGYDLEKRSFGAAMVNDETGKATTDLDLVVFLTALAKRRAVINLAGRYTNVRAATVREGEMLTSRENRHGRIKGVVSNQHVWSQNILVDDMNVMSADEIGKDRNFQIQGLDGSWYPGWHEVEFWPEGDYEKKLFEASQHVTFKHCISPSRWPSIYGRWYLLAKVAEERLKDQERFLKAERKRLQEALSIPPKEWPHSKKVGAEAKEKFWAFNAEVVGFKLTGDYDEYPTTKDGLTEVQDLLHRIKAFLRELRVSIRASEYAFWQECVRKGLDLPERPDAGSLERLLGWLADASSVPLRKPAWVSNDWVSWRKSTRSKWQASLDRDCGLTLRWRAREKTESISATAAA